MALPEGTRGVRTRTSLAALPGLPQPSLAEPKHRPGVKGPSDTIHTKDSGAPSRRADSGCPEQWVPGEGHTDCGFSSRSPSQYFGVGLPSLRATSTPAVCACSNFKDSLKPPSAPQDPVTRAEPPYRLAGIREWDVVPESSSGQHRLIQTRAGPLLFGQAVSHL